MHMRLSTPGPKRLWLCVWLALGAIAATAATAQTPAPRIRAEINNSDLVTLSRSAHPLAQSDHDAGRMPAGARLSGITIAFNRSAAQQAELDALLAAQQDPTSPQYHQWLTPEQFAARFGMAQADLEKVQQWLEQQGFAVDSVARGRNMLRFSGTVNQVEQAFQTEMHYFNGPDAQQDARHFGPARDLSVPAAIAPTIAAVRNLTDFRPKPMHVRPRPGFTSSISGGVFFSPADIATVYNINSLYGSGVNGAGQAIAIIGQSSVSVSDVENFQKAAGLTVKDPTVVLVPGTGASTSVKGDEGESDLDLEWSGATAPGADIFFVYTGNNTNKNAFDAIQYAVDERLAPIISISYGACETALGGFSLESVFAQAATQGQTILASSGDQGSTGCSGDTSSNLTTAQQFGLAVNYPASSPYITAVGGTEITPANSVSSNSTYWVAKGTSDELSSAKIYIPEISWNDNSSQYGLSSSGGGPSALFPKPSWQTGVPGIPNDGKRDVPDISLYSSPGYPGYLYCTSDASDWNTSSTPAQSASCNKGFRDSASNDLTIAGGTSFAAPIFAGVVALLNQKQGYASGQGLLNPTLYKLASKSATYSSAFHDITSGNNNCNAGSKYCGTTTGGFTAGPGYDEVTGLGSIDAANLVAAWPSSSKSLIATRTDVVPSSGSPAVNVNDSVKITVSPDSGPSVPTGTITLDIDGGSSSGGKTISNLSLASGSYTYTAQFTTGGTHQVVAKYSGDATHATSTGVASVTVGGGTGSASGNFAVAGTNVTVAQGSSATSTITVTPKSGYTGTVDLTFGTSNNSALANLCYSFTTMLSNGNGSVAVTGTTPVTTQLTFDTKAADCVTGGSVSSSGFHRLAGPVKTSRNTAPNPFSAGVALSGLLFAGLLGGFSRRFRSLALVLMVGCLGLALSACGGVSSRSNNTTATSTTASNPAKGTYTITITGTDSASSSVTSQSTFTLVIN